MQHVAPVYVYQIIKLTEHQGAAECAIFFSICTKLQHLANAIINAGFVMIQSARVWVGRFAEGVRARDFPLV